MTANLRKGPTVKQTAATLGVSERAIYMARELMATGNQECIAAVNNGTMSLHGALKIAKPEKYDKRRAANLQSLKTAWRKASDKERDQFVKWVSDGWPEDAE
jgi:formiminotetrahydrofolate cyclodeaminase